MRVPDTRMSRGMELEARELPHSVNNLNRVEPLDCKLNKLVND
jgi:hypothetical protein